MKVKVAFIFSIVFLILVLQGCNGNGEILSARKPVELTVWHYYSGLQKRAFDNAIKEFNDTVGLEKGVYINAVGYGSIDAVRDAVLNAAAGELDAGTLPDIFTGYVHTTVPLYEADLLIDLEEHFTEVELEEFIEVFLDMKKAYNGELRSIPAARSTEFGMLNQTDFDYFMNTEGYAKGLSYDDLYTFEGIIKISSVYYQWSDGKSFYGISSLTNLANAIAAQLGEDEGLISQQGGSAQIGYTKEMMQKVWEVYYEGIVRGYCNQDGRALSKQNSGDILYLLTPTINMAYFPKNITPADAHSYPVEMMALPMPYIDGGSQKALQLGGGISIVKSDEKTEQAAVLFLKWLIEDENNGEFVVHSSGYIPVKDKSMENILETTSKVIERQEEGYSTLYDQKDNILKGTKNFIQMFETYDLVFPSVYSQSHELSLILDSMAVLAIDNRSKVLAEMGTIPLNEQEEAYQMLMETYCSAAVFDDWYESFDQAVRELIGGSEG